MRCSHFQHEENAYKMYKMSSLHSYSISFGVLCLERLSKFFEDESRNLEKYGNHFFQKETERKQNTPKEQNRTRL